MFPRPSRGPLASVRVGHSRVGRRRGQGRTNCRKSVSANKCHDRIKKITPLLPRLWSHRLHETKRLILYGISGLVRHNFLPVHLFGDILRIGFVLQKCNPLITNAFPPRLPNSIIPRVAFT